MLVKISLKTLKTFTAVNVMICVSKSMSIDSLGFVSIRISLIDYQVKEIEDYDMY